ncbi:MAG: hypothetical protein KGS48_15120 [Bacteroidetes bacterium]|nr:hypothetical protein [Bacteroidota bacterium]
MRFYWLLIACILPFALIQAQNDTLAFPSLEIGNWHQHLPWQRATYVTQSAQKTYFATEWAIVEIDKAERTPRFITKVEGLSDVGIQLARYNAAANMLLIAYTNSNIDLYKPSDGTVINLPFIKKDINLIGDKKIYDVYFDGANAYLACGFGVLKLKLDKAEAEFTTFTGVPVLSFSKFGNFLYAGTEEGVYRIPENDVNLADFGRWSLLGSIQGLPQGTPVRALTAKNNQLYLGIGKELYTFNGQSATLYAAHPDWDLVYLTSEGPGVLVGWRKNFTGAIDYIEPNGNRYQIQGPCDAVIPEYAVEDGFKKFWIADLTDKFRYFDLSTNNCESFVYNSPFNQKSAEIEIGPDGTTYVATPGPNSGLAALYYQDGVYVYKDDNWTIWNKNTIPALVDTQFAWVDLWKVAADPNSNKVFVGSWVGGLQQFDKGAFVKNYTQFNSILKNAGASGTTRTAIGGLAYDKDGNLWISNYGSGAPIAVLKPDGSLLNFSAAPNQGLLQVAVDQNGYKWFVVAFNGGIMVYDSGKDLASASDDRYKIFTTSNSVLPTNTVNCVSVDLDGDVWVGTQQGAVSFECGSNVFESSCTGRRRIVNVDGFNGYLLETEDVKTIAVDGANRKWFGTSNGVFVQSSDGLTQVANYTSTNSPLFDNNITDIAINQTSGEVWIGTEKGLISLRGDAVKGGKINNPKPYAYPNPVRPDYDGPIAIYGLARDANVKITDIRGNLVYEGTALGGQAVWNGKDYLGRRAASGVYLIYATSKANFDTPDAVIAKVVIIN